MHAHAQGCNIVNFEPIIVLATPLRFGHAKQLQLELDTCNGMDGNILAPLEC